MYRAQNFFLDKIYFLGKENVFRSGKDVKLIWRDYAGQRQEHAELKEAHRLGKTIFMHCCLLFICVLCLNGIAMGIAGFLSTTAQVDLLNLDTGKSD